MLFTQGNIAKLMRLRKKAVIMAREKGYEDLAEDFAQEALLYFFTHPDHNRPLKYILIDYLRSIYGSSRKNNRAKYIALRHYLPLTHAHHLRDPKTSPLEELTHRAELTCMKTPFSQRDQAIFDLYFIDGLTLKEIGKKFKITEGRVSQIVIKMKALLKRGKKKREDNHASL